VGEQNFRNAWFLGFIGLNNTFFLLPFLFLVDVTGFEPFQWPDVYYTCVMSFYGLVAVLTVYSWTKAVIGLGPALATSTFAVITFPMSIFLDVYYSNEE
jgi:hypothetical protein